MTPELRCLRHNLIVAELHCTRYEGSGLLQALVQQRPTRDRSKMPLRAFVKAVYNIKQVGTVVMCVVGSGTLTAGMDCTIGPLSISVGIEQMQFAGMSGHSMSQALPGDHVTFLLELEPGVSKLIKRGHVISERLRDPVRACHSFFAQIVLQPNPFETHSTVVGAPAHSGYSLDIKVGYQATVHCHSTAVGCRVTQILARYDDKG